MDSKPTEHLNIAIPEKEEVMNSPCVCNACEIDEQVIQKYDNSVSDLISTSNEIFQVSINMSPPCPHYNLFLDINTSIFQTIICFFCCAVGFISIIGALFLKSKCDSDNNISPSSTTEVLIFNKHWLYDYGYDKKFIERRKNCFQNVSEEAAEFCGLKFPYSYKIKCLECGIILKKGNKAGGLIISIIFGVFGIIIFLFAALFVFYK